MVFDPMDKQMLDSSRASAGRAGSKRGGFRRKKSSRGRTLGAADSSTTASEEAEGDVAPPRAGEVAPPAPAPEAFRYNDERVKRVAQNARLRALSYPAALGAGAVLLAGGLGLGLELWMAGTAASVGATVVYKIIDSRIR